MGGGVSRVWGGDRGRGRGIGSRVGGGRTARVRISMSLFADCRPRAEEMMAAQEVVSSVVVLPGGKPRYQ